MTDYKQTITRRKSRKIMVGKVAIGGDSPVSVQSMTNTNTADVKATVEQIKRMENAGVNIVRSSCPDEDSTKALKEIIRQINVPMIADIHFHYQRGIEAAKSGAACLRINPGNIGGQDKVKEVVKAAKDYGCSIRIGVNGGSLEKKLLEKYGKSCPEAMVESALTQAKMLEDEDFREFKISVKSSNTMMTIEAYRLLAKSCDYPLHLGVTETGNVRAGIVKSAIGIGSLLREGIGDTLRVSLTAEVEEEVKVGFDILRTLGLYNQGVNIISCPTCSRTSYNLIPIVNEMEKRLSDIKEPLTVAIMGCVVNGPGEAQGADIALVGGTEDYNFIYIGGERKEKVKKSQSADALEEEVRKLISNLG